MGCFNTIGFHTQLPICAGDEVFGLIGVLRNKTKHDEFSPGTIFTPIMLPIFGEYDDYGTIEDIKSDENTKLLENITGVPIREFIKIIDDNFVGRVDEENKYDEILNKLSPYIDQKWDIYSFDKEKDFIFFIMDHRFFYDECVKNIKTHKDDFEKWCKETEEFKNKCIKEKLELENKYAKVPYTLEDIKRRCEENGLWLIMSSDWVDSVDQNIRKINKKKYGYHNKRHFLELYKGKNSKILVNELKESYCDFLAFFRTFKKFEWMFEPHHYGGQRCPYKSMLLIYEKMVEHIKNAIEKKREEWEDYDEWDEDDF